MITKTKLISGSFMMKTFVLLSFLSIFSCSQNETPSDVEKADTKEMILITLELT